MESMILGHSNSFGFGLPAYHNYIFMLFSGIEKEIEDEGNE